MLQSNSTVSTAQPNILGHHSSERSTEIRSVQILRGAAALIVVFFHAFDNRIAAHWASYAGFGVWGVDIFFVISGLVMWVSTERHVVGPFTFVRRRIERIYPLYWVVLTAWIAIRACYPDSLDGADVTLRTVVMSYLLVPHYHAVYTGMAWPILTVGWTLQLELLFYAVFAACLMVPVLRARLLVSTAALLILSLVSLGTVRVDAAARVYTSPLLLEFAAGLALGAAVRHCRALAPRLAAALAAAGIGAALILNDLAGDASLRPVVLGIPAVMIVAAALACEDRLRLRAHRFWMGLGAASYSLYLTHPIGIAVVAVAWTKTGLPRGDGPATLLFVPIAIAASVSTGFACHRWVEKPLLAACKAAHRRGLAGAPRGEQPDGSDGDSPSGLRGASVPAAGA